MKNPDTVISAISTPIGTGGIGIIRLSGSGSVEIAASIFRAAGNRRAHSSIISHPFESHRFYYGHVIDPENMRVIDEAMLVCMMAPRSYTREDVVEVHIHSGLVVLRETLELVLRQGARLAEPGEFTRRAFLNGRIDLIHAEAVIDLINSKSSSALEVIHRHLSGELSARIENIKSNLLKVLAIIDAGIDFPDEVDETHDVVALAETLKRSVLDPCEQLVDGYKSGHFIRDGLVLAVVGKPNVGKSSLMNRLVGKQKSIVTDVPGTTRDLIEVPVTIDGIPIVLCDTAGIHPTHCPIEIIGIQKAQECIEACDLVLFVLDASTEIDPDDLEIFENIKEKPLILIFNKMDLVQDPKDDLVPDCWKERPRIDVSAKYDLAIDALRGMIIELASGDSLSGVGDRIIPNLRQKLLLEKVVSALRLAINGMLQKIPQELLAIDLNEGLDALNEMEGDVRRPDVLDRIFSQFCIGK